MRIALLENLENDLKLDKIGYQEVADLIFKSTKPWQTIEWKNLREQLLKDYCEQCDTKDRTMVIQHFWHPQDYSTIQYNIVGRYVDEYYCKFFNDYYLELEIEIERVWNEQAIEKNICPKCSSINFNERITKTPKYRCNKCKLEFDEAAIGRLLGLSTKDEFVTGFTRKFINERIWVSFESLIRKEALLESITQHKKYISFEGTKTFCSKCAFLWDKKGMKLCDKCKTKYHNKGRLYCSVCN
jgi:hypothetical protein